MKELPQVYLHSMQRLLEGEFAAFLQACLAPATTGLRANTLKLSPQDLLSRLPYELSPVPWCPDGFRLTGEPGLPPPGRNPYHAAGLYYLQEPSGMAVAELLDPQPGERILDLCAAPGGKSTHLTARMGDDGLLIANETHPKRVWELVENLERWGAHHVMITNESPNRLAERLPGFFDRVLVDAPCSGEGMFRQSEAARRDGSPELVRSCALRQSAILEAGARLTRPGGVLGYSTCTFNPQENEGMLAGFLQEHPDFELVQPAQHRGLSPGHPEWAGGTQAQLLERAIRIWPHLAAGEGHFFAAMRRAAAGPMRANGPNRRKITRRARAAATLSAEARKAFADFCQAQLSLPAQATFPEQGLVQVGENLYLAAPDAPDLEGLHVIRAGWWLGVMHASQIGRGYRFEPSQALAMGLKAGDARRKLDLEATSAQVSQYLRGEVLEWKGEDGWVLVCVDGFPLGWGRGVQGKLKNHYPRGLRWA